MNSIVYFFTKNFFLSKKYKWLNFDFAFMIVGIILSVATLTCSMSIFDGYEKSLQNLFLSIGPELTIYDSNIDLKKEILVDRYSQLIYVNTLVSKNEKTASCLLQGIDHQNIPFALEEYIIKGTKNLKDPLDAIIGDILAKELQVEVGQKIVLFSSFEPSITPMGLKYGQNNLTIVGIYKSGFYEHDQKALFIKRGTAKKLFAPGKIVTCTGVKLKDVKNLATFASQMRQKFYTVQTWDQYNKAFFSLLKFQKFMLFLVLSFLIVVAAFGTINSVSVFILKKKNEIGLCKSFGMGKSILQKIFLWRIVLIAFFSIIFGQFLGYAFGYFLSKQTLYLLDAKVYLVSSIKMDINWLTFALVFGVSFLTIYMSIVFPLKKIYKMQIRDILV